MHSEEGESDSNCGESREDERRQTDPDEESGCGVQTGSDAIRSRTGSADKLA
jgi:hypothetical protein